MQLVDPKSFLEFSPHSRVVATTHSLPSAKVQIQSWRHRQNPALKPFLTAAGHPRKQYPDVLAAERQLASGERARPAATCFLRGKPWRQ